MSEHCICFTTDSGYLFPTLLSAIQARKFLRPGNADVVILLFTMDKAESGIFDKICRREGIILITADTSVLQGRSVMYARLFLNQLLPATYTRFLYIDGDVQITQPLDELIETDLHGKAFSAVADPMAIMLNRTPKLCDTILAYFAGLGITSTIAAPYFNSGVLLIDREPWAVISADALKFLDEHPNLCLFQDQSALNFAGHDKFAPMSFRWNFPIFFRNCGVEEDIKPGIYHFMSKPKPWNGVFAPWNKDFYAPYVQLVRKYPELGRYQTYMPVKVKLKYFLLQHAKRIQETIAWRYTNRRSGILEFDAAAKL